MTPRYLDTVATGSPAHAAHLLANGFNVKEVRATRRGTVVFVFHGSAVNSLAAYKRAYNDARAHISRTRQTMEGKI